MVATPHTPDVYSQQLDVLTGLLNERLGRHELFFEIDAGTMPDGSPEITGYALDTSGQAYWIVLGWDAGLGGPALTTVKRAEPEAQWMRANEYRAARRSLGLPVGDVVSAPVRAGEI